MRAPLQAGFRSVRCFPEALALVPLCRHEAKSCTPAYKAMPVREAPCAVLTQAKRSAGAMRLDSYGSSSVSQ